MWFFNPFRGIYISCIILIVFALLAEKFLQASPKVTDFFISTEVSTFATCCCLLLFSFWLVSQVHSDLIPFEELSFNRFGVLMKLKVMCSEINVQWMTHTHTHTYMQKTVFCKLKRSHYVSFYTVWDFLHRWSWSRTEKVSGVLS